MKNTRISLLFKIALIITAICGVCICALWYPFTISVSVTGGVSAVLNAAETAQFWAQLAFYWLCSLPCFIILYFLWKISGDIKKDKIFTVRTAKSFNLCAVILFIDVALFVAGNIIFAALKWNYLAIIYFFVSAAGIAVAIVLTVVSCILSKAAVLKEEFDGTI